MTPKRSLLWVVIWVLTAVMFSLGVRYYLGSNAQLEFLTCYAIEWSLSMDNLFVFLMIFTSFGMDGHRQLRALRWGIIGAIVLRFVFIVLGVTLVSLFEPILYIFGAFLIYSAYKMAFGGEGENNVRENRFVKLVRKRMPVTKGFVGDKFFIRKRKTLIATPMFLVLVAIESSDVMFAVDSIPAAFAITRNPYIIFFSNMFAIMGLRSLYFLLAHADKSFGYLKYGVSLVLAFVGAKMLAAHYFHISGLISLCIVLGLLVVSILASILVRKK